MTASGRIGRDVRAGRWHRHRMTRPIPDPIEWRAVLALEPWEEVEPDEDPAWLDTTVGEVLAASGDGDRLHN